MKVKMHKDCIGVRGIKFFKCSRCGAENSNNYMNGVDICHKCIEELNICPICGKEL